MNVNISFDQPALKSFVPIERAIPITPHKAAKIVNINTSMIITSRLARRLALSKLSS